MTTESYETRFAFWRTSGWSRILPTPMLIDSLSQRNWRTICRCPTVHRNRPLADQPEVDKSRKIAGQLYIFFLTMLEEDTNLSNGEAERSSYYCFPESCPFMNSQKSRLKRLKKHMSLGPENDKKHT